MISYAQNREDVLLARVFRGVMDGFYVDIGAFLPVEYSVTKHFYDLGWSGINVEPGVAFEALAAARTRDVNLQVAVADRPGIADFFHADDPGSSVLVSDLDASTPNGRFAPVAVVTLNDVLEEHACGRRIDFLKIDIEGGEGAVIRSTNWRRYRPIVLVIEATYPQTNEPSHHAWEPVLINQGYLFAYFDGINRFYVREEDAHLLDRLQIPVNVLDEYQVYADRRPAELVAEALAVQRDALADRLRILTEDLRAPDGPRSLQLGLFLARLIRRLIS